MREFEKIKTYVLRFFQVLFFFTCIGVFFYEHIKFQDQPIFTRLVMTEEARELGVRFEHRDAMNWVAVFTKSYPHLTKWFQAVSASVAVADVNNDGWQDIFLSSSSFKAPSHLYINQLGQGFLEKAEEFGLHDVPNPIRSIFLDCDNDGDLEFFTSTSRCPILYKKDAEGKYKKLYDFDEGPHCLFTTAVNVLDYNKDNLLDIVFANLTRNSLPNSSVDANNGGQTVVLKNVGNCRFVPDHSVLNHKVLTHVNAIGVGDIFNDGSQDIWLGTDFNNDWIYKQEGLSYKRMNPNEVKTLAHNAMSSEWAYLTDEKYPFVFVSHIFEPGYFTSGNMLWSAKDGRLKDYGKFFGVDKCGWSWGSKFADLNNDSFEDLIVTNGFISNSNHKSAFFRVKSASAMPRELVSQGAIWKSIDQLSYAGHQRDCIFMNNGNKGFQNVSESVGFDAETLDGRGLASADFNNDGLIDLVVANQRQRTQLYMNKSLNAEGWIGFELRSMNRTAIGANIILELQGGRVLRKALFPYNGYASQSDSRLHFGLGDEKVDSIHVKWLDGTVQKIEDYKLNAYNSIKHKRLIEGVQ